MTPLRFAITSPHQDVKRTYTSKLSFMNGVPMKMPALNKEPALSNVANGEKLPAFFRT